MLYAGYLLILQDARKALGNWALLTWSSFGSVPVLLAIALALGEPVWPGDWRPLIALVICGQLIGQGLLVFALKHFSPLVIGIALLTQPAVAALVGWLAFGEVLTVVDLVGVALVGSALVLAKVAGESTPPKLADTTAT
jgi:drug/metabolite transporter (DMT)-like permease